MDYHVFKKSRIVGGKKIHKWYYYYRQSGKQIQKVCKNCTNRSMAESYIRTLPSLDARPVVDNHAFDTYGYNMAALEIFADAYCRDALGLPGLSWANFWQTAKTGVFIEP